jgi:phospholipase/lecithinase/hemolysin
MGINDIIDATDTLGPSRTNYIKALSELRGAGAKLVLVGPPDLGKVPRWKGTSQAADMTHKSKLWNSFVKKQASRYSAGFVDLFTKLTNGNLIESDGLHPNAQGQRVIANAIAAKL